MTTWRKLTPQERWRIRAQQSAGNADQVLLIGRFLWKMFVVLFWFYFIVVILILVGIQITKALV